MLNTHVLYSIACLKQIKSSGMVIISMDRNCVSCTDCDKV